MDPTNPVTLLIPLIGIALVLGAVWLAGGTRPFRLDAATARRRLAEDAPGFTAAALALDEDSAGAIAAASEGPQLALLFVAGDKVGVRVLAAGDVRGVEHQSAAAGERLLIEMSDFTLSRFALRLPAGAAALWAARLSQLVAAAHAV
jgi:hypothetical protein